MTIWNPDIKKYSGSRYKALADAIADDIKLGILKPKQKLPTHRALAEHLGVTVGTITRGYAEAEKRGLIMARMGSGTFVSGQKSDMADYLESLKRDDEVIDLSLSITLSHGQESILSEILTEISQDDPYLSFLVQYESEAGIPHQRKIIADWLKSHEIEANKDRMIICNGGQNAINTILSALTSPDDRVLSESLTYPGFTYLARQHQLKHYGVQMDQHGLIPEHLESLCQKLQPKLLYSIPTLQNPTTSTLSIKRRQQVIEIATRYDLLIIEDQVQGILHSKPPIPLVTLNPEQVVYCGSFSKIFAGGLRVGYILTPKRLLNSLKSAFYLDCLFAPPLMTEIACRAIQSGRLAEMIKSKRIELKKRQALVDSIFKGMEYYNHPDCLHTWLILPEQWDPDEFVLQLQRNGVLVKSSKSFAVEHSVHAQGIRICLTSPEKTEDVEKGLRIIRDTLDRQPGVWQSIM
ncbi:PLP-dependent aminotransferase family protein [bacterium]|nr:PLP-dependent aminotransferase family protein [bacterium]